jgi:hypothetical protein
VTNMPQLPRRRVEPLPPPPGAFDTVLNRARARRYRRLTTISGVTGVFLAGVWGGLAMAGGVAGVQDGLVNLASRGGDLVSASSHTGTANSTAAVHQPSTSKAPTSRPGSSSGTPTDRGAVRVEMVRGLVVDGAGTPAVGMYVYTGTVSGKSFVPRSTPSAVTDQKGRYAVPCTDAPVLLTPWVLNDSHGAHARGRWAAEYVTSPTCSRKVASTVTEVQPGAAIVGQVSTDHGCADSDFSLWLWLNGNRRTTVRLGNLNEGDAFEVTGLPRGTHVLGAHGRHTEVTVAAGSRVTQDVTFDCPDLPTPTDTPTASPPSLPLPTETATPDPTGSSSPTGSSTAAPSGG